MVSKICVVNGVNHSSQMSILVMRYGDASIGNGLYCHYHQLSHFQAIVDILTHEEESTSTLTAADLAAVERYQSQFDDDQVDCQLIVDLLDHLVNDKGKVDLMAGAVLVFLPGVRMRIFMSKCLSVSVSSFSCTLPSR